MWLVFSFQVIEEDPEVLEEEEPLAVEEEEAPVEEVCFVMNFTQQSLFPSPSSFFSFMLKFLRLFLFRVNYSSTADQCEGQFLFQRISMLLVFKNINIQVVLGSF